ncbi:MAG TPA: tetratricopeptide repeat protein [Geobacteraceae bacterium]
MIDAEAEKEFLRGLKLFREGNSLAALTFFERASVLRGKPSYFSCLGFCIAKERGQVRKGLHLCREALEQEPDNTVHYLNLGRIHLVAGNKQEAIRVFREGLAHGANQEIADLLNEIGTRKQPVIPSLGRNHPVNKYLGIILSRLGLR